MRRLLILFLGLLTVFAGLWAARAGNPTGRPDSYAGGLTDTGYWWDAVQAEEVSSNWQLSAGVPDNYIPVPGKSGLYMVVDGDGYITGYRKGTRNQDGSWNWEDVNPDIPENYEAVPGLENVYKVTGDDGSVRYFRYIRNKDDTYAFVEVDARGNMLGETIPTGSEIPSNYERVSRNQFAVKNENGVVIGYKERIPDKTAEGGFTWVNIDEPDPSQLELPDVGFDLKSDATGTGDITGGIREIAGFTGSTDTGPVPTLMPSGDVTGSVSGQNTGGFVFAQPEIHIEITQSQLTPGISGEGGMVYQTPEPNPGGYSFSGDITVSTLSTPETPEPVTLPSGTDTASAGTGNGESSLPDITVTNQGYYTSTETSYTRKQEGNWLITYSVTTEKTYDAQGNLIGTNTGQPVEVSRQQTASNDPGSPAATLSEEYSRITGLLSSAGGSFNASVPNELVKFLNTERGREGLPALTFNGSSPAYQLALCRAAMMAVTGSGDSSLPGYGKLSAMCAKYGVATSSPSENMLITSASSAESIHAALQSSSGSSACMSSAYTEIAVAIAQKGGRFYIVEVFIR